MPFSEQPMAESLVCTAMGALVAYLDVPSSQRSLPPDSDIASGELPEREGRGVSVVRTISSEKPGSKTLMPLTFLAIIISDSCSIDEDILFIEKSVQHYFFDTSMYALSPAALNYLPRGEYIDIPLRFTAPLEDNARAAAFPLHEYWPDVGYTDELECDRRDWSAPP